MLPAEQHEAVTEVARLCGRDESPQRLFHLDRVLLVPNKAETVGQPDAVRVAHDGRLAENIAEDEVCGLASDARQPQQLLHRVGHPAAVLREQHHRAGVQVARLGAEQAAAADILRDLLLARLREALERRKIRKQLFRHDVHARIRTLRGEPRREQQLVVVRIVQCADRFGIDLLQPLRHRLHAFLLCHGSFLFLRQKPRKLSVFVQYQPSSVTSMLPMLSASLLPRKAALLFS